MRSIVRGASALLALCIVAGCSASASNGGSVLPATGALQSRATTEVVLRIVVPAQRHGRLRSRYVSPSTKSLVFVVSQENVPVPGGSGYANLTPASPECSRAKGPLTCIVAVPVQVSGTGTYAFALATFDQRQSGPTGTAPCTPPSSSGCAGRVLSQNIGSAPLTEGTRNNVAFTLGGIPAAIRITPLSRGYLQGGGTGPGFAMTLWGAQTQLVLVQALDADGNAIVGPGEPNLRLTSGSASKLQVLLLPNAAIPVGAGIFGLRALTRGEPPIVSPGNVQVTAEAMPQAGSGGATIRATGTVTIAHAVVYVSTAGGPGSILAYYDGNAVASARLDLRPDVAVSTVEGLTTYGSELFAAHDNVVARCAADASSRTQCRDTVSGLRSPRGVTIDAAPSLFVANGDGSVWKCPDGASPCTIPFRSVTLNAAGLAEDAGNTLLIANTRDAIVSCPQGSSSLAACSSRSLSVSPFGIAIDKHGIAYVSSPQTNAVYVCPARSPCSPFVTGLHAPRGIAVDAAGTLYVANSGRHEILECARGGRARRACTSPIDLPARLSSTFVTVVPAAVNDLVTHVAAHPLSGQW